jgi:ornithine carbamoyltransferase
MTMNDALREILSPLHKESFGTLSQLRPEQLGALLDLAQLVKSHPQEYKDRLNGAIFGLIFEKHSTRTRVSFEVGIRQLGGDAIFLSRNEIQLGRGEPIEDTAKVLSRYVQGIVLRTFGQDRFDTMAESATVPVINALTDQFHPCQILADLQTIREHRGPLRGQIMTWLGDGNNMAHSLMLGCALSGMHFRGAIPSGYGCDSDVVQEARKIAASTGGSVTIGQNPAELAEGAHVVVTDVFTSMGQEDEAKERLEAFRGFQVNSALMELAHPGAIFLHCLPAHRGEEVSAQVIDGPQSVVWDEAENRLHAQKALILALMGAV